MHLYSYDPAPNPQRLVYFLKLKKIELPTTQIDLGTLEQLQPSYRAINPSCTVPCLILESGQRLTEVIAICQYLENEFPEHPLMGTTSMDKALVLEWDHRIYMAIYSAIADMLRNGNPNFVGRALPGPLAIEQLPDLVERGRLRLHNAWELIDEALANREFLVGDSVTLADIDLYVALNFAGWVREKIPESAAHLTQFRTRMAELLS
ncbi:MAG TPA: glutathione S-transferase [Halieaceae bacterium]|jgi:glutathione S-transferase|nr:glutathione S-transferase [Halieaceae bacterium]